MPSLTQQDGPQFGQTDQRQPHTTSVQTPEAPQSLDELLRSSHNPAHTGQGALASDREGSPAASSRSPLRDERRWNGFHLWRTESEDAKRARQRRAMEQSRQREERQHRWQEFRAGLAGKLRYLAPWRSLSVYRDHGHVDFNSEHLHTDDDRADQVEPRLSSFGLMVLTLSLAGAQLAWTLELAYGTPYLLSLGLKEKNTSLVWLAGPLSGLIAQPVIGSLSDKSTSKFRRRRFMIISALLVTTSTLVLAFSVPLSMLLIDLFGGGLADWDPRRDQLVHATVQWISVTAFWILDFALNGLQASSRALILDIAPSYQQSVANAWHGRMTHAGNVVGYLCGWLDLGRWRGLAWLGGGQFRRFAVVSLLGMLACVSVTVTAIEEKTPQHPPHLHRTTLIDEIRVTIENVWQTIRRLPRPVRRVCLVQFFAYMGWFPFLFYSTTYVLQIEDGTMGHSSHDTGADTRAERGSFAMLIFALVALVSGALLPYLSLARERQSGGIALNTEAAEGHRTTHDDAEAYVDSEGQPVSELQASMRAIHGPTSLTLMQRIRRGLKHGITLRTFWTIGSLSFAALMVATFFVQTVRQATVVIALVGLPWSVASWAPFAMVAEFVREAEEGQSPFEFDEDHWSPRRTQARVKARRRSSLLRSGEFTRRRTSLLGPTGELDAKSRLNAALTECEPLRGSGQSPARRGRDTAGFVARGSESISPLRPNQQMRSETGLTGETDEEEWENAMGEMGDEDETKFGGTILGIHNLAIVVPQFVVAIISAVIFGAVESGRGRASGEGGGGRVSMAVVVGMLQGEGDGGGGARSAEGVAWVLRFGGLMAVFAALAARFVPLTATERRKRDEADGMGARRGPTVDRLVHDDEVDEENE